MFRPGDWIVYRVSKYSSHPTKRALDVRPELYGEKYAYDVEKFWAVVDVLSDGRLLVQTRRGKQRVIDGDDSRLRHASFWEQLFYRNRFPAIQSSSFIPNTGAAHREGAA